MQKMSTPQSLLHFGLSTDNSDYRSRAFKYRAIRYKHKMHQIYNLFIVKRHILFYTNVYEHITTVVVLCELKGAQTFA